MKKWSERKNYLVIFLQQKTLLLIIKQKKSHSVLMQHVHVLKTTLNCNWWIKCFTFLQTSLQNKKNDRSLVTIGMLEYIKYKIDYMKHFQRQRRLLATLSSWLHCTIVLLMQKNFLCQLKTQQQHQCMCNKTVKSTKHVLFVSHMKINECHCEYCHYLLAAIIC